MNSLNTLMKQLYDMKNREQTLTSAFECNMVPNNILTAIREQKPNTPKALKDGETVSGMFSYKEINVMVTMNFLRGTYTVKLAII